MSGVRVAAWPQIERALEGVDLVTEIERALVSYSRGECVVAPVGELVFDEPRGDVHVKSGYVRGEELYVVKVASGFYANPDRGLPSGNGLMLLFRQATGEPVAVLLDEGRLTDLRTAAAGAVAAKHLAPPDVRTIGVLGTGTQARRQVELLRGIVDCDRVLVWGRDPARVEAYRRDVEATGFDARPAADPDEIAAGCELVVTTTPATAPLFSADSVRPGTHVTAVGSDAAGKQELEPALLARADRVVADSREQCRERGEIAAALRAGAISESQVVELGEVVEGRRPGRSSAEQVTVADLTGVAVQDVRIASVVYGALARG